MSELFISGGVVIDPEKKEKYKADLLVKDGVITQIGSLTAPPIVSREAGLSADNVKL